MLNDNEWGFAHALHFVTIYYPSLLFGIINAKNLAKWTPFSLESICFKNKFPSEVGSCSVSCVLKFWHLIFSWGSQVVLVCDQAAVKKGKKKLEALIGKEHYIALNFLNSWKKDLWRSCIFWLQKVVFFFLKKNSWCYQSVVALKDKEIFLESSVLPKSTNGKRNFCSHAPVSRRKVPSTERNCSQSW